MAKVKSAKDRITAYMKAKGWDATDIKDAFDELDSADADLGTLADALQKNQQWTEWYQTASPEIQKIAQERDTYKSKLDKLQAAGLTLNEAQAVAGTSPATTTQPNAPAYMTKEEADVFKQNLAVAASDTMEQLIRVNFRHFKEFGSEADLDALKGLMKPDPQTGRAKAGTVDEAYRQWSEPLYTKKRDEDTQRKIDEGIKKGIQDAQSKLGIPRARKTPAEKLGVENAPLDKPAPSEKDLRDAFMADLDEAAN